MGKKLISFLVRTAALTLLAGCGNSERTWNKYVTSQKVCEIKIEYGMSYWDIAKQGKEGTELEDFYTQFIASKLEKYMGNPKSGRLMPGQILKIPCGLTNQ